MYKFFTTVFVSIFSVLVLNGEVVYRKAKLEDVPQLLELINTQAIKDNDKIVILPKKFRRAILEKNITDGKLFIAENVTIKCCRCVRAIIAYKKMYVISDQEELLAILKDELRCYNTNSQAAIEFKLSTAKFHNLDNCEFKPFSLKDSVYIYNGSDFTHPNFRNKSMNKNLTNFALESISAFINKEIKNIYLLYGLTEKNAGNHIALGRTKSILESFIFFIKNLNGSQNSIYIYRFNAFMPTFDLDSEQLKPLDDNHSVPGYGYVVAYSL